MSPARLGAAGAQLCGDGFRWAAGTMLGEAASNPSPRSSLGSLGSGRSALWPCAGWTYPGAAERRVRYRTGRRWEVGDGQRWDDTELDAEHRRGRWRSAEGPRMTRLRAARATWYAGAGAILAILAAVAVGCDSIGSTSSGESELPATTVVPDSAFVGCFECHEDPDQHLPSDRPETLIFNHVDHEIASESVGCGSCHPVETHLETTTVRPTMKGCYECHGVEAAEPLPCSSCHPLSVVPRPPSHQDESWGRAHAITVLDPETSCDTCHQQPQFCDSCHGTEMPHPDGWLEDRHAAEFVDQGEAGCAMCHGPTPGAVARSDCDTCHHPGGAVEETWLVAHSDVASQDGGESCTTCHSQQTFCTACHGVELPHPVGWLEGDHAVAAFADDDGSCALCHGQSEESEARSECDSCHHPGGDPEQPWLVAHPNVVRFEDAQCFSCHAQATCAQCHVEGATDFQADRERFLGSWVTADP